MTRKISHIVPGVVAAIAAVLLASPAGAQGTRATQLSPFIVDSIVVVRGEVFDSTSFLDFFNNFHGLTREQVVLDEVFFEIGDTVSAQDLDELERNLRSLEIFSRIELKVETLETGRVRGLTHARLVIHTRDAFTLRAGGSFSTAGTDLTVLGSVREFSLFGTGLQVGATAEHTSINGRGWRLSGSILDPNISGSHLRASVGGGASDVETTIRAAVDLPLYSPRSTTTFSVSGGWSDFEESFYFIGRGEGARFAARTETADFLGWYAIGKRSHGSLFNLSAGVLFDATERDTLPSPPRAFENVIGAFLGVHSLQRSWVRIHDADFSGDRLVPIGGQGSVTLGKISPHSGGLDNAVYVGGEARQAAWMGPVYTFATLSAGTGLAGKRANFTSQRFAGTAWLPLHPGALAARVEQSTIWNWPRYAFLSIDNATGLRGYDFLSYGGNNRLVASLEYRLFPIFRVKAFDLGADFGATAFYDIGTVWNQGEMLGDLRFHSSAGLGLRISNALGVVNRGILRVDLAFNFDERRISRLIISTQESFDAFGTLDFRPPVPYLP